MSDAVDPHRTEPYGLRTRSCATELACRDCGYRTPLLDKAFKCPACGEGLDVDYDYELAKKRIAERPAAERPWNIWRFEELLPILNRRAQQRVGQFAGKTPLIHAERLGAELGLSNLYIKDDSTNRPSLSYKDRVVGMAIARLLELGKDEVGCVSTGNVGTAVAALAAQAGATPYIFYPGNMEKGKAKACRAMGAQVIQLDANYDGANRACRELALATGMEFANITLRPFYAEGAKTMAFEVVEELGWQAPDHFVIPAAGGTLSSRVHKGLVELETVGLAETAGSKINIAQASGCSPIATAIRRRRRDRAADAGDGGPLDRDRRARRRRPRRRRGALARRLGGDGLRRGDLRRDRPARRDRGHPHRAGRRHDDRLARRGSPRKGRSAPDETVVAVISGNGLKTLHEHPEKPWPEMVPCEVGAMEEILNDFRQAAAAAALR